MSGGFLTPIIAIFALIVSSLSAMRPSPAGTCVAGLRCFLDEWMPVAGLVFFIVSVVLVVVVGMAAFRMGPEWLRDMVERLMLPPDSKPSGEMSLEEVVKWAEPRSVRSPSEGPVIEDVQKRVGELMGRLQSLAAADKLSVFGRYASRGGAREANRTLIPLAFWGGAVIEYSKYLDDPNVVIQKDGRSGSYDDLRFDRKQIRKHVPKGD